MVSAESIDLKKDCKTFIKKISNRSMAMQNRNLVGLLLAVLSFLFIFSSITPSLKAAVWRDCSSSTGCYSWGSWDCCGPCELQTCDQAGFDYFQDKYDHTTYAWQDTPCDYADLDDTCRSSGSLQIGDGCIAASFCNDITAGTTINPTSYNPALCSAGTDQTRDRCSSTCARVDTNICDEECGADSRCDGVVIGNQGSCPDGTECDATCQCSDFCTPGEDNPNNECQKCKADGTAWENKADGTSCTDDGDTCSDDICSSGACTHPNLPYATPCDDGLWCTRNDNCRGPVGSTTCQGDSRSCSDGDTCTSDSCNEATDQCVNTQRPSGSDCGSCKVCNAAGSCVDAGGKPSCDAQCQSLTCNAATDTWYCNDIDEGGTCDDGLWCTINDVCFSGSCVASTRDCSESPDNICTSDSCNEATDQCVHDLKCDGTTCSVGSAEYCSYCDHCGDGVVNCGEACDPPGSTRPCLQQACLGTRTCQSSCTLGNCVPDEINEAGFCSDGYDNDCDGEWDYDTSDRGPAGDVPPHGDSDCPVGVTAISSPSSGCAGQSIEVRCTATIGDANSISAYIDASLCSWDRSEGNDEVFSCSVGTCASYPCSKTARCTIQTDKSYQSGTDQTASVTVNSCCASYDQASCPAAPEGCEWCNQCSGTKYSGGAGRCVSSGACSYYCWTGQCTAECDDTAGVGGCTPPHGTCDEISCNVDCGCEDALKCDGTTCSVGSPDYCSYCDHCTDGVQNCGEDEVDCGAAAGCAACVCDSTDSSCGIWPACSDCDALDDTYCTLDWQGREHRDWYCISNAAGCDYSAVYIGDCGTEEDVCCNNDKGTQLHNYYCTAPAGDGPSATCEEEYQACADCPGTFGECYCSVGACVSCSAGENCVNNACVVDECSADSDCDDGNPCTNDWCENPAAPDSVCHNDILPEGTKCDDCKTCDAVGNCNVDRPDGYNDCGGGCQRCVNGVCADYNQACDGSDTSCYCLNDVCGACAVDSYCSDYTCVGYTCDGTDTSCGIWPACSNCNADDDTYCTIPDWRGREHRDWYCVSNAAGCDYSAVYIEDCGTEEDLCCNDNKGTQSRDWWCAAPAGDGPSAYCYDDYGVCNNCPGTFGECYCSVGACVSCSAGENCVNNACVVDECSADSDCDDGNSCTNDWCENPAALDSVCHNDNEASGTWCDICKVCDNAGNCNVDRPDGYNDCGGGCQRCVNGVCADYNQACDGSDVSCYCLNDVCGACAVDSYCSDYTCVGYTCDGTDTSCGIWPACSNCDNDDGACCTLDWEGRETRDYYCVSNAAGCDYSAVYIGDCGTEEDVCCDASNNDLATGPGTQLHNYYCSADVGDGPDAYCVEEYQTCDNCAGTFGECCCSGGACVSCSADEGCVDYVCESTCGCTVWEDQSCGGGGCLPTQMWQTRTCDDDCDVETQCVDPVLGDWEDQGCGLDCGTAGTCEVDEQCRKQTDIHGCADNYVCTSDANCIVHSFEIYRGWNLISSPAASITSVIKDTCGATGGNFYFYNVTTDKWVVDITGIRNLQKGIGYWFHSSRSCNVTIAGTGDVVSNDISIKAGWNQIGSPTDGMDKTETNLMKTHCEDCAGGICEEMKILWYNPAAQEWREVDSLGRGKGYQIQCVNPSMHEQSFVYFPLLQLLKFFKIL